MINAFPQQKTESSSEAWMQAADRQLPPASRTLRQNIGRPNIEAINKLAHIGNGLRCSWGRLHLFLDHKKRRGIQHLGLKSQFSYPESSEIVSSSTLEEGSIPLHYEAA